MSLSLHKFIERAETCNTREQIATVECEAIIKASLKQNVKLRQREVLKLVYLHIAGIPLSFVPIETIFLAHSSSFSDKRVGYLSMCILMQLESDCVVLATSTMLKDLYDLNPLVKGLSLEAIANVAPDRSLECLVPRVAELFHDPNSYVRRKALLCAARMLRALPDMHTQLICSPSHLNDNDHALLLAATTLIKQLCKVNPEYILHFQEQQTVLLLVNVLKRLLRSAGNETDHDEMGVTDPFLQVNVLQLLRIFGKGNVEASSQMQQVLAQIATNTVASSIAGQAVLYECALTIAAIESENELKAIARNILMRFLSSNDPNVRFVAIQSLRVLGERDDLWNEQ